ncbi:unnamed protein product [Alternaria alternata]
MTIGQARGTASKTKKHSPILQANHPLSLSSNANESRFGGRLLRPHVGPKRRQFSAHEDMLCKQSTFFKNQFQTVRKDIEGECVVCHEDLHALIQILTYCKTCGNNLHQDCMKQWFENNNTCPTCRSEWIMSDFLDTASLDDIDADGFDVYVQWLYGRIIPIYKADKGVGELRCSRLIGAHIVGDFLKDTAFLSTVRKEILKCSFDMTIKSRENLLIAAYRRTERPCELRRFLVELYTLQNETTSFSRKAAPSEVYVDILACLLEKARAQEDKHVWSSMSASGYIGQNRLGTEDFEEAEDGDMEGRRRFEAIGKEA